jgi:hypothetical protein
VLHQGIKVGYKKPLIFLLNFAFAVIETAAHGVDFACINLLAYS